MDSVAADSLRHEFCETVNKRGSDRNEFCKGGGGNVTLRKLVVVKNCYGEPSTYLFRDRCGDKMVAV